MTDINKIAEDGFSLADREQKLKNLAMISLRIALQAYFSTYKAIKYSRDIFDSNRELAAVADINFLHNNEYCQNCAETIVHFQHFAELICKEFLRSEHDLLAIDASSRPVLLHKLLKKETIAEQEYARINTIEFGEALKRLCTLVKEQRMGAGRLEFICDAQNFLEKLNSLRNRLWHRGAYVLRYQALDHLVGEYVLPFASKVTALPEYKNLECFWKYKELSVAVDPIEAIISTCSDPNFDHRKVAILKELGRAAYNNPLFSGLIARQLNEKDLQRAILLAEGELETGHAVEVKTCPVCGIEALSVYEDVYEDYSGAASPGPQWRYPYEVKCMCCSLVLQHDLKNASTHGLPLEDYWYEMPL